MIFKKLYIIALFLIPVAYISNTQTYEIHEIFSFIFDTFFDFTLEVPDKPLEDLGCAKINKGQIQKKADKKITTLCGNGVATKMLREEIYDYIQEKVKKRCYISLHDAEKDFDEYVEKKVKEFIEDAQKK